MSPTGSYQENNSGKAFAIFLKEAVAGKHGPKIQTTFTDPKTLDGMCVREYYPKLYSEITKDRLAEN